MNKIIKKNRHYKKIVPFFAGSLLVLGLIAIVAIQIREPQDFRGEARCPSDCEPCDRGFNFRSFYDTQNPDRSYYGFCNPGQYYCNGNNPGCFSEQSGCLRGNDCNDRAPHSCCFPETPGPTSTPAPRVCQETICIPSPTPTNTPTPTATPTNTPTPTATPTPVPLPCCADIVFIIDRSNSVLGEIQQQNQLLTKIINQITNTQPGTEQSLDVRMTIVSFGNNVRNDKPEWDYDFDATIDAVNKDKGLGGTCIECALDRAEELLNDLESAPPREETTICKQDQVHKVVVFLTDGQPTIGRGGSAAKEFCAPGFIRGNTQEETYRLIQECITKLENKLVQPGETLDRIKNMVDKFIVIGIGKEATPPHPTPTPIPGYGVNHDYLERIASDDSYFSAESFASMLRDQQQQNRLGYEICHFGLDTPPPPRTSHAECSASIQQIADDTVQINCQVTEGSNYNKIKQTSFYIQKSGVNDGEPTFIGSKTCGNNIEECLNMTYRFTDNQCFKAICKLDYQ